MPEFVPPEKFRGRHAVNVMQMAEHYGVDRMTVKRRLWEGRIPYFKLGRDFRIKVEDAFSDATAKMMEAKKQRSAAMRQRLVYFIGSDDGPIKIGLSADPRARLVGLQTSNHGKLSIMAISEGGPILEREYHERFASHRLNGEWFERTPEILAEIERLQSYNSPSGVEGK